MGLMEPNINGITVQVYAVASDAEKHPYRNRYKDRDNSYELIGTLKAQPYFFSEDALRTQEGIARFRSLGYLIFKNASLNRLGISPAPDAKSWANYRIRMWVNTLYKTTFLRVTEARPRSPLRGSFKLWYAYVEEADLEPIMDTNEEPMEERGSGPEDIVVEIEREYGATSYDAVQP